jgi:hypothetical protein
MVAGAKTTLKPGLHSTNFLVDNGFDSTLL